MKSILIDSDVILDFFLDREPFCEDASIIISLCERKRISGYVTPVIISNLYYLLRKVGKRETVVSKLKDLISFIDIVDMNREVVIHALNSAFNDFEDALQNYAARYSNNISTIITRNIKDYKHSELNVMTPSEYLRNYNVHHTIS